MTHGYYDRDGRPIDLEQYARLKERRDPSYTVVAKDTVDDATVSTVWLGLDHGWGEGHAPLIFETLVFDGGMNGTMERYATEQDALLGHSDIVARVRHERMCFGQACLRQDVRDAVNLLRNLQFDDDAPFDFERYARAIPRYPEIAETTDDASGASSAHTSDLRPNGAQPNGEIDAR